MTYMIKVNGKLFETGIPNEKMASSKCRVIMALTSTLDVFYYKENGC